VAGKEKDTEKEFRKILANIKAGEFAPFYLLMGDEPYYADVLIEEIINRAILPDERDFNLLILYGMDVSSKDVVEASMKYPMMAARQLVIVKEAQFLDKMESFEKYFSNPLSTTLLVLAMNGKTIDGRTILYKKALENGVLLETVPLKENKLVFWIDDYVNSVGKKIDADASMLMADYCGTELRKLAHELNKLITNLDSSESLITTRHIEDNIGISREYNLFELTKALSFKNRAKAFKIASHFGDSHKLYPLVVTLAVLFSHFSKVLKYHSLVNSNSSVDNNAICSALGIKTYHLQEYVIASDNYSYAKCMEIVSLIRKCDSVSKGNERGEATDKELLTELVFRITH
jgi:DNA polymerase-3 subunit delta